MSERAVEMLVFSVIFNILFASLSFAFTSPAESFDSSEFQISLDENILSLRGIDFKNATSYNLTFGADWTYFELDGVKTRVVWAHDFIGGDGFMAQIQNIAERYLNTWFLPVPLQMKVGADRIYIQGGIISNSTIVSEFDVNWNWLEIVFSGDKRAFITTTHADANNITKAVYETGILTLTIGEIVSENKYDFWGFVTWYWEVLFSQGDYAVPFYMDIIIKIMFALNLISAVLVAKDLTRV